MKTRHPTLTVALSSLALAPLALAPLALAPLALAPLALASLVLAQACGGSPAPASSAADDDAALLEDDEAEAAAPASSEQVKQGMKAIEAGDFEKAKGLLESAASQNPDDPQAAFYLGVAFEGLGDGSAAVEQYEKALKLDPGLVEAAMNLSAALLDGEDAEGALKVVDDALKRQPNNVGLLQNRGYALAATGDNAGAAEALGKAAAAKPDDEELAYAHAEALAAANQHDEAKEKLGALLESDQVEVLASASRLLGRLKDFERCIQGLDRAIDMKSSAELYVNRGLCHHGKQAEGKAREDFQAAIAADASFAPAYYYLGVNLREAGKKAEAKAALTKAKELGGDSALGQAAQKALSAL